MRHRRAAPSAVLLLLPYVIPALLFLLPSAQAAVDADAATPPPALNMQPWEVRLSLTPSGQLSLHWLSRADEAEAVEISEWGATGIVQKVEAAPEATAPMDGVHSRYAVFPALRPGGSYIYRLPGDGPAVPFRMPRQDAAAASVLVLADMGTWGTVVDVVRALGRALEGDVMLHLGDLSYAQDAATWDKWAELMAPVLRSRPALFIPGNWDAKTFAWPSFTHRFYSPLLSAPTLYRYSFAVQRMRFVMVNSYEAYTDGSDQYRWLADELRAADTAERRRQQPWLIVCFHSPMYSSSTGHGGGDEAFRKAVEPLLLAHHVDLCLSGHDHGYERSHPIRDQAVLQGARGPAYSAPVGAPIHLLVGTAGATHDPWIEPQPAWSLYRESAHGFTRLRSFANNSLLVELVRTNDSIADRFWLVRAAPAGGGSGGVSGALNTPNELPEPHADGWLGLVPSVPFLAVLFAGLALPALVLIRYFSHGRAVYSAPIRRNSSFLVQRQASN